MTTQFESGKHYGNDLTIEILKRTEKTVTIKTVAWGVQRVKVREWTKGVEGIHYKAWIVIATENFDENEYVKIAFEKAYN